jgi:tetratricopeptide (TPR) repeat protein
VLGDVTGYNRYVGTANETNAKEFQPRDFFFAQDTWRVTPKLTLNYGLRYEYYAPERVNGPDNGALLNLQTGFINVAGVGGVPLNMGVAAPKFPFNPRLGVAYQFNQKTVIRAGYGRSFDLGVFGSTFGHVVTQNIPVLANQSASGTAGYTSYAFQLDNPSQQGGLATGLSAYSPVQPNAQGQIPITAVVPGTNGQTVGQFTNVKARPFTERLPTLDAWNLSVQRSLTPTLSVTVAYVGNKGTHTLSDGDGNNTNPNEPAIVLPAQYSLTGQTLHFDPNGGTCITGSALYPCSGTAKPIPASGATSNQTLLQRFVGGTLPACGGGPCNWIQGIAYYGDDQDTHYNALQVTVSKQLSRGLSANLAYAYQHALSTQSGFATCDKQAAIGNDSAVRRNSFTGYALYKLPFGRQGMFLKDSNSVVNEIVGGWEISPIVIIQTGLPFTLGYSECGSDIPGDAPCEVDGNAGNLKMQYSGTPGISTVRAFNPVTSGGAFTRPGLDTIGNVGRNTAWGRGFWTSNLSLMKNFAIKERINLQLRMDAYNALNHINFGGPNGTIDSSNAGQIEGSVKYVLLLVVLVSCAAQSPAQSSAATSATATQPTPASIRRLIDTGHPDDALAAVDRLHAAGATVPGLSRLQGLALYAKGDLRGADAAFAAALTTDPADTESAQMRGLTLFRLGRPAEAIPLLSEVDRLAPSRLIQTTSLASGIWTHADGTTPARPSRLSSVFLPTARPDI